ncbi:MAG: hypothetical protein HOC20_09770 [Chloroflexi bacterium]|nr:hypothetical protein [Chloroflexota bacterium]
MELHQVKQLIKKRLNHHDNLPMVKNCGIGHKEDLEVILELLDTVDCQNTSIDTNDVCTEDQGRLEYASTITA